mmetsp:Transcript_78751/g.157429  ORF Transcript_78751/g.157429 Transcript_78751/m.157429 type:complete len:238 (-) Transcript_78751:242-955(-)
MSRSLAYRSNRTGPGAPAASAVATSTCLAQLRGFTTRPGHGGFQSLTLRRREFVLTTARSFVVASSPVPVGWHWTLTKRGRPAAAYQYDTSVVTPPTWTSSSNIICGRNSPPLTLYCCSLWGLEKSVARLLRLLPRISASALFPMGTLEFKSHPFKHVKRPSLTRDTPPLMCVALIIYGCGICCSFATLSVAMLFWSYRASVRGTFSPSMPIAATSVFACALSTHFPSGWPQVWLPM